MKKIAIVGTENTFANLAITPTNQLVQINEPFKEEPIQLTELSIHPEEFKTGKELRRERRKAERKKKK